MDILRKGATKAVDDKHKNDMKDLLLQKEPKDTDNILKRCLYDPVHKRKVLRSVWVSLSFLSMGLVQGQFGPTFLDLQIITRTKIETGSLFLTGNSVGFLAGSIICGVIYDRVNKPLFLLVFVLGLGLCSIIIPFCFNLVAMIFMMALVGVALGFIDSAGNAEQMRVWGSGGQELMQMVHFTFSLGGVISPLYSEPFLAKIVTQNSSFGNLTNSTDISIASSQIQSTTNVQYAYLITGILCIVSGIPWLVLYIQDKADIVKDGIKSDGATKQRDIPLPILMYMIIMLCVSYFFYFCLEVSCPFFLMTFLVEEYNVSKSKGARVTSVFWGLFAVSRFVMIFISHHLSAVKLLFLSCFLMTITSVCFTISASYAVVDALIVFTALFGFSISALFAAGFTWAETELFRVTGRISAGTIVASSIGGMICPLLQGYLMARVSNMWFCYLMVIETVLMCLFFFFLFVTSRYIINKRYEFVNVVTDQELEISVDVAKMYTR